MKPCILHTMTIDPIEVIHADDTVPTANDGPILRVLSSITVEDESGSTSHEGVDK